MNVFSYFYERMIGWAKHHHAPYYLAGISFIESSFFPIPPDVMLITMGLATPRASWRYALIATLFSVMGGLLGYAIGAYAMDLIMPYLQHTSYLKMFDKMTYWFDKQGVWVVILAGFTPFPYKIFTISAGATHMPLLPFFLGSVVGRGLRFFLVSGVFYFAGEGLEARLRRSIDILSWTVLALASVIFCLMKWVF